MQEWMQWEPVHGKRFASLKATPARLLVGAGALVAVVAGLMPWAEGVAPGRSGFEPVSHSALGDAGDGVMLIVISIAVAILTLHRTPAESRTRTVRIIPAVLVALAVFTWLNGRRAAEAAVEEWAIRGGSGRPALGMWMAAAGIGAMVLGTLWLLPAVVRWQRHHDDPEDLLTFSWAGTAELIAGTVGLLVGGVLGINVGLALTGPMIVGTIFLGAVFGGLLGAYAAMGAAGAILRRLATDRGAPPPG